MTPEPKSQFSPMTAFLLVLPLILLGLVIMVFINTSGGLSFETPAPIEIVTVEQIILKPDTIDVVIRNTSPEEITIAQIVINDAVWPFTVAPANTIPRLGQATVHLDYMWVEGEAYGLTFFTSNSVPFAVDIPVAFATPQPTAKTFWSFTLIGIYVGIIPIYLGLFWLPALRQLSRQWMTFLLAVTIGLLIFLGIDTFIEALEQVQHIPSSFQGNGLIGIGIVATFMLLNAVSQYQSQTGRSETAQRLQLAYMIALGIGLHNLGEGLAIGAAYNVGEVALGSFLVVGFIIQNITEGLGIIAPILRDRPSLSNLVILGLVGGLPAVFGAWIGGFSPSATLAALFFAIGTGAILQVVYEINKLLTADTQKHPAPFTVFSGVITGMMLLWITGLWIK